MQGTEGMLRGSYDAAYSKIRIVTRKFNLSPTHRSVAMLI